MPAENLHEAINYVEFPCRDLTASKTFFAAVFGWAFTDYGEQYVAFTDATLAGGFYHSDLAADTRQGSALIVLYSNDLAHTQAKVEQHGGVINKPIFDFPGGRRFHFQEPSGNELAVWSDK